jgi:hypothetical protein
VNNAEVAEAGHPRWLAGEIERLATVRVGIGEAPALFTRVAD